MDFTQALNFFSCYVSVTGNGHARERQNERQGETPCKQSSTIFNTCLDQSCAFFFNRTPSSSLIDLTSQTILVLLYFELNFMRLVHLPLVYTYIFDSISFSLSQLTAFNLLWCFVSYLRWWKPVVMPRVTLLLLILSLNCWDISLPLFLYPTALFLSALTCSQSPHSYVQTLPTTLCPSVSPVPRRYREQLNLSVVTYSDMVIDLPSKTHIVTLLYFMNTL